MAQAPYAPELFLFMNFLEFKTLVLEKAKEKGLDKNALIRLRTELFHAEVYYKDVGDLYEDLKTKTIKTKAGVIPYILGFTDELVQLLLLNKLNLEVQVE